MTLNRADLIKLAVPGGIFIVLTCASALLVWYTGTLAKQASQALQQATTQRNQVEIRLRQVRAEEEELRARSNQFQALKQAGTLGSEKRLDWVETLQTIQKELRIPGLKYEFSPQIALDKGATSANATGWQASPLSLHLRLLHEGDLLSVLARIEQETSALVIVDRCKLGPLQAASEANTPPAQLSAECNLRYLTARHTPRP